MGLEWTDIDVCTDCLLVASGADIAPGEAVGACDAIAARWGDAAIVPCGEDDDGFFSWAACDGCGSTLGGMRHPASAAWRA
jgi:hypothetical protein